MSIHRTTPSTVRPIRTPVVTLVALVALVTATAACSPPAEDDAEPTTSASSEASTTSSSAPEPSETPSAPVEPPSEPAIEPPSEPASEPAEPASPTLAVTISGDKVRPNAAEVDLGRGEPLVITFDSDRAGELHVHSKPEQYVEFEAGASEQVLVIETPGEVEVEDHETGAVVAVITVN